MSDEQNQIHPPRIVSQNRSGSNVLLHWLIFLLILAVVGCAGFYLYSRRSAASAAKPDSPGGQANRAVPVAVATAKRGDLPIYLDAPGTVTALNTVTVRARVDGQIVKVNYTEGQTVNEGDVLIEIDPRPFQVALDQAIADRNKAQTAVDLARATLLKDQAQAHNAKSISDRNGALLSKGFLSKEEFETGTSNVDTLNATIKADAANIGSAENAVHSAEAAVDGAKLQLSYCKITAPITGKIGLRLVDVGNMVRAGDSASNGNSNSNDNLSGLAVITQVQPISVTFSLAEDFLPQVKKANANGSELPVEVYNRDRSAKLATGKLVAMDSQIDLQTLTAKFKAQFENKDESLFPNQAVNVRLLVDTRKNAVLVPITAIQRSPDGSYVYVVKADKTVEMRPIKPGPKEGELSVVEESLSEGEVVVTQGVDKLEPGMSVTTPDTESAPKSGAPSKTESKGRKKS